MGPPNAAAESEAATPLTRGPVGATLGPELMADPARCPDLMHRTAALLPAALLVLLHAVAFTVPPERLHEPGIHDGADYDSLIQPLVLALSGVSVEAVGADRPAAPRPEPLWVAAPSEPRGVSPGLPPSRAPPVD